jgi:flagellar secretion chaperone FliS
MNPNDPNAAALQRYLADQVTTATPAQRLLMLFDVLHRDLLSAQEAFTAGDLKVINDHLVHAQQVLMALRDPLDASTEIGRSLHAVYTFCLIQLVDANMRKDRRLIDPCLYMLDEIAEANRRAAAELAGAVPAASMA